MTHRPHGGDLRRDWLETTMEKMLLTPVEAASALGIGRSKLYELLHSGRLPSVRIGACRRIPIDDVHRFVTDLTAAR
jgi:excisionase family DNA binding protein